MKDQILRKNEIISFLLVFLLTSFIGLTSAVAQNYASTTVNDGLMAYYPFDGNANDASGNGYHATPCNNFQYEEGVVGASIAVVGEGHCVSTGGHVLLPEFDFDVSSGVTLSLWVKALSLSNEEGETYISLGTSVVFEKDYHSERLDILQMPTTISFDYRETEITIPFEDSYVGTWVMYTLACSSDGTMRAYVNGELVGEANVDYDGQLYASLAALGRHWWDYYDGMRTSTRFTGSFDEVRIYNRAITSQEVSLLYNSNHNEGTLPGLFSVGENTQVYFSQGNLQYQASTNTWRFAENQWDYVGDANANISESYDGWIDLFGWGTSGYNHGANCYQPWSISTTYSDYYAYGNVSYELFDQTGQADWGYNAIQNGGNQENSGWRTLTRNEWNYVLSTRNTLSGIRYAKASVNNINGLILLPDTWSADTYNLSSTNSGGASFSSNTLTGEQWSILEQAGAVFLPAAGFRSGSSVVVAGSNGYYWTAVPHAANRAFFLMFDVDDLYTETLNRYYGSSVRLVRPAENYSFEIQGTPSPAEGGSVTGLGTFQENATCTLTASANEGYIFLNWTDDETGDVVSTQAEYTFVVTRDMRLTAHFAVEGSVCEITVNLNDSYGDGWNGNKLVVTCADGIYQEITLENGSSSTQSLWMENGSHVSLSWINGGYTDECSYTLSYSNGNMIYMGFDMSSDFSYEFDVDCVEMPLIMFSITTTANPEEGGIVTGTGEYALGEKCTLTATANDGYTFMYWTENGVVVSNNAEFEYTVIGNSNLVANFTLPCTISVSANPTEGGVVTGTGDYEYGSTCTLTATANDGYMFMYWIVNETGEIVSNEANYAFIVKGNSTLTAHFAIEGSVCEITVNLNDSDGDGWNGNKLVVTYVDGKYQEITLENGSSDTQTLRMEKGSHVTLSWINGSYTDECSYTISYLNGNMIYQGSNMSSDFSYEFDVDCEEMPEVTFNITAMSDPEDGGTIMGAGNYDINATCTLTAVANEGYSFANWTENGEVVSTEATYSFTVTGDRNLIANFTEVIVPTTNHWIPETESFEDNMTFTAVIQIDGVEQYSPMLEVGAFCGEQCRGSQIASLFEPTQRYLVQLTIFGEINDLISFRLYDHATEQELDLSSPAPVSFSANGYGTLSNPSVLNFTSAITHEQSLSNGWNWWSTYVELEGTNALEQLENSLGANGLIIKSRNNGYVEPYNDNGTVLWYGTLSALHNEQTYKVNTNGSCVASITGLPVNPANHPITLNTGWNWIGFPSTQNVSITTALSGLDAASDDIIKGRNGYASYYAESGYNGWYGTINSLESGQGYMYHSNSNGTKTFTYNMGRGETTQANITPDHNLNQPQADRFADNMTVTAVVTLEDVELRSEDYELAAFVGNECRGSVKLMFVAPVNRYVAFLTVFGEPGEELSFRLTDGTVTCLANEVLTFVSDGTVGSLSTPETMRFGTLDVSDPTVKPASVYPNPSKGVFFVEGQGIERIEVYNSLGQCLQVATTNDDVLKVDLHDLAEGMYLLRVVTLQGVSNHTLIKK